jgi:hypothetical protein
MWDLSLRRWVTKPKSSVPRKLLQNKGHGMNLVAGMEEPEPLQVLYTDFTEILVRAGREEGVPDAIVGSYDDVGDRLIGRPSSEHGVGVRSAVCDPSGTR